MITDLAEQIRDRINNRASWPGLTPAQFGNAVVVLDPESRMELDQKGLYVIPLASTITEVMGRASPQKAIRQHTIVIIVAQRFQSTDPNDIDVSDWASIKSIIDFREELENYVISGFPIADMDSEPAREIELKQRWFVAITELIFEESFCLPQT
ncbi:MAG: hypothetical protein KatS3mg087_1371 [Patescibacteria group bacterium]|nr:MAG: hypothetical protein KatS3mg087_1371 [Patescibacteria group bacterium]